MDKLGSRDVQEIDLSVHPSSSSPFSMYEESLPPNFGPNSSTEIIEERQLTSNANYSTAATPSRSKNNLCNNLSSLNWKNFTLFHKIIFITLTITICALILSVIIQFVFTFAKYPGE